MVRFDDALPTFVALARAHFGPDLLARSLILRDANGRLTLIIRDKISSDTRKQFDQEAEARLGAYVSGATATPEEIFDPSLSSDAEAVTERVPTNGTTILVKVVDRRVIGQDWNHPQFAPAVSTPMAIFYSVKGGVGRTTALAVAASAFSDRSKNVLIIDLDLEAPGVGPVLLPTENLPKYGALDYFIENGMGGVDDSFLEACVSPSPLTAGRGLVEVVPAVGRIGRAHPENVVPKLGRAFLDDPKGETESSSFRDQARALVRALAGRRRYDAIFVDARAGLSESASAAILGLGGEILMFGVDTPQTFDAYSYLLAHLSRFTPAEKEKQDWRYNLRMIHAKAGRSVGALAQFRDRAQEIFATHLYEEADPDELENFNFDIDDPDAPHFAWPVPYDADYAEFNPAARKEQLTRDFFDRTFGPFVDKLGARLLPSDDPHGS
ncbi:MAG TPA: hypothetical protein VFZ16_09320 [Hyphomicrobiaceae bacterium]|nr:hypothetical protein [Hyphomicrobiaceae bacterium]